jgi:hypothetical protein
MLLDIPVYRLLLELELEIGEIRLFDMNPYLDKGVLRQIRAPGLFSAARVDDGVVTWPGEIDMAPVTL